MTGPTSRSFIKTNDIVTYIEPGTKSDVVLLLIEAHEARVARARRVLSEAEIEAYLDVLAFDQYLLDWCETPADWTFNNPEALETETLLHKMRKVMGWRTHEL